MIRATTLPTRPATASVPGAPAPRPREVNFTEQIHSKLFSHYAAPGRRPIA